ncbi:MAG: right-handed parallel beta-helix repeat-containing protein [Alphaproteobacteria bacterium]|nr:right-handed parallel beta-helix repeat-containing protein [Alphaproteobacteria bacterium]
MYFKNLLNSQSSLFLVLAGLLIGTAPALADTTLSPCASCDTNQVQINAALKQGGIVTLSSGTYVINSSINLRSNSTLKGSGSVIIKLADNLKWERYRPIIHGSSVKNIRVVGIEVDGNRGGNASIAANSGYFRQFFCYKCLNVEFDHSYLHDNLDTAFFLEKSGAVNIHDNVVRNPGYNGVFAYHSDTVYVTNNCLRASNGSGVHVGGASGPVYVINNNIASEANAKGFAGIYAASSGNTVYNCNNTIHDISYEVRADQGSTISTGNCSDTPAPSTGASSCNIADMSQPSAENNYGATTNTAKWTVGTVYLLGSGCPNSTKTTTSTSTDQNEPGDEYPIDGGDAPQIKGHMVGGFGVRNAETISAAKKAGGNTMLPYLNLTFGLSRAQTALTAYASMGANNNMKVIDDVPDQLIRRWHSDGDESRLVRDMEAHLQWLSESGFRSTIAGYWMIDDWHSDFGKAREPLQRMTTLIHKYTPDIPAICGFSGNTSYGNTVSGYMKYTLNYSDAGCDMVGVYMYPYGGGKNISMSNLKNIIQALKAVGWDPGARPLVGIPQTYGGLYGYDVPTAAQVESETKYMCEQGAKHILGYNFNTATNASNNSGILAGLKAGIEDCKAIWGD